MLKVQPKRRLRSFQREDVNRIKEHHLKALIASAPGTGKTAVAIRAVAETQPHSMPALVICPASVTRNWAREIRLWSRGIIPIIVDDSDTRLTTTGRPSIYITSWALLDARWSDFLRLGVKVIIADEAHYAKNPEALRSQALYRLTSQARGVLLLTGTPIVNTEAELETLNVLLGPNPLMIRRLLEDVAPDIPAKKRAYLNIELRPKDEINYQKATEDFEDWLRKQKEAMLGTGMAEGEIERILAAEALVKIGYLRRLVGEAKVPAAADWIARAVRVGEPVVVFVEHQAAVRKLSKALRRQRIKHTILEGSTSNKKRQQMIDDFQKNKYPVFIGTKAAKEGITLTAARHLLFVERFFTSADEEQAEDRIRRIGQTQQTTIWFLHAVGTVDDRIDTIVRTKRGVIRKAIGSADIMETPTKNVEALIRDWANSTDQEEREVLALGLGDPLPPLPKPCGVHAIVFRGPRWTMRTALIWCEMNGYRPTKGKKSQRGLKLILRPVDLFTRNKFQVDRISREICIITGRRLSQANERKVKKSRNRMA